MGVRSNTYFNNPAFAQAASNLSALFAPPSGADANGWANANAKKAEAARLQQLFDNPTDPNFDRRNIAVGNYAPTQSFYAQDQNNSTAVRAQDVTAATSRANNAADNAGALARQYAEPVKLNQGETAYLPQQMQDGTGLSGTLAGAPKPLSETELLAQIMGGLPAEAQQQLVADKYAPSETQVNGRIIAGLSPEEQRAVGIGSTPVENVVTEDGPRIAFRADAVGQEPFVNKGAEAAMSNGMAVINGQRVAVVQDRATGKWVEAQTGAPIPANIEVLKQTQVTGSADEAGITTGTKSDVQKNILAIDETVATATTLRDLITANPSSQGIVGSVRKLAQNLFQTANELGQNAGPGVKQITDAVQQGLLDQDTAAQFFDPGLEAIDLLTNYLSWQYAKTMGGDRVSNEQLRAAKEAIGGSGILANNAASTVRLNQIIEQMGAQRQRYGVYAPDMQAAPAPGTRRKFNPVTGKIE